ncbi:MAG: hypothetical protein HQK53_14340 [Oligoflexia bacterium]|nr:hypothetical protein [Oligoflexia bacterium]
MKTETVVTAIIAFILGAVLSYGAIRYMHSKDPKITENKIKMESFLNDFFNDDFFLQNNDPFQEMKKFREYWRKNLTEVYGDSLFNDWYSNRFGGNFGEISKTENSKTLSYKITIPGLNNGKVDVKINERQVKISGSITDKQKDVESEITFKRIFPVARYADTSRMDTQVNGDIITLKFPKINDPSKYSKTSY